MTNSLDFLKYIEFGVSIHAEDVDTKLVNETVLRQADIIEDTDETEPDATLLTPVHSRLEFKNGLKIVASRTQLLFTLKGEFSESSENRCPQLAMNFVDKKHLRIPFNSVSTKFKAVIPYSAAEPKNTSTARFFANDGTWFILNGSLPELSFKATYRRNHTTKTLGVGVATKVDANSTTAELYEMNFHRELLMSSLDLKYTCLIESLMKSGQDCQEFRNLISNIRTV